ncbi:MAG TPA: ATP-binding cassette domain-containing protein [Burkholderiaceae bacterium]|nr:ATP-binding cassette domain-containing protein [Burkholderiaceae bacterium]
MSEAEIVIRLRKVCTHFGRHVVHQDLDLEVRRGEILAIVGGSGSGKSVLLREMILLQKPSSGAIDVLGTDLATLTDEKALALRKRWGVMFQHGGLFSALTVRENVGLPLREHSSLADDLIDGLAEWKISLTGLPAEVGLKFPGELSGGMLKRASLARAIALDPELLFLDEPTSGLDPASSAGVVELIRRTHALYGLTIVMITHDLDLMWQLCDRVAVLGEGKVLATGSMTELSQVEHPIVRGYFVDPRARKARERALPGPEEGEPVPEPAVLPPTRA